MCRGVNARMILKRARFSACINQEIDRAFASLQFPDENLSHAVLTIPPSPLPPAPPAPHATNQGVGDAQGSGCRLMPGALLKTPFRESPACIREDRRMGSRRGCHQRGRNL